MHAPDRALSDLGRALRDGGYEFTTITPESHRRVNARPQNKLAGSLRDVFGWSRPFDASIVPRHLLDLLTAAQCVVEHGGRLRSTVRYSTYRSLMFVHSAFPTTGADSVFFGPDTYRFLNLLAHLAPAAERAVDIGSGTGAGGLLIAPACGSVTLTDINPVALRYAAVNADLNDIGNSVALSSDILAGVDGQFDLIVSNPPYLIDAAKRTYRDGGGQFGEGLSRSIVTQSLDRLAPRGRLILYTATAVVDGVDTFFDSIRPILSAKRIRFDYSEIDPDVFGDELETGAYRTVDRIAAVGLDLTLF